MAMIKRGSLAGLPRMPLPFSIFPPRFFARMSSVQFLLTAECLRPPCAQVLLSHSATSQRGRST